MTRLVLIVAVALATGCQGSTEPGLETAAGNDHLNGGSPGARGSGGDVRCTGTLTGTFDNVTVPVGATCTLVGSTVKGNVKALERARLFMADNHVEGNVEGDKAAIVHVSGGTVNGNIQIKDGVSPAEAGARVSGTVVTGGDIQIEKMRTGSILVASARVLKGNIQITENATGTELAIVDNAVAQNLQVFKNGGDGARSVTGNQVGQDLQCKENASPFAGGPNTAGETEGQCS